MATTTSRGRISVDLRGLRPALERTARESGVTPSAFTRRVVAAALSGNGTAAGPACFGSPRSHGVKVSLKLSHRHAAMLRDGARLAGMFPSAFVEALLDGVPDIAQAGGRSEALQALTRSNAELAAVGRNLNQIARSLHRASSRDMASSARLVHAAAASVQAHLQVAAGLLTSLQSRRRPRTNGAAS